MTLMLASFLHCNVDQKVFLVKTMTMNKERMDPNDLVQSAICHQSTLSLKMMIPNDAFVDVDGEK